MNDCNCLEDATDAVAIVIVSAAFRANVANLLHAHMQRIPYNLFFDTLTIRLVSSIRGKTYLFFLNRTHLWVWVFCEAKMARYKLLLCIYDKRTK